MYWGGGGGGGRGQGPGGTWGNGIVPCKGPYPLGISLAE